MKLSTMPHPQPYTIGWLSRGQDICISHYFHLSYGIKPFKDEVLCDVSPLEVYDVILGKPYIWKHHVVYESRTYSVIVTLWGQIYTISEVVLATSISLILAKHCRKVIY
jgi:hypothetical protein